MNLEIAEPIGTRPGGTRIWRADYFPLRSAAGEIIGVNGMAEVRAAADALRQSEVKYRSLVETTSDCIWEFDAQACYTYLSPRFREMTGNPPEAYLGKTPLDLLPDDCTQPSRERLVAALAARKPVAALEMPLRRRDGSRSRRGQRASPVRSRGRLPGDAGDGPGHYGT